MMDSGYRKTIRYSGEDTTPMDPGRYLVKDGKAVNAEGRALLKRLQAGGEASPTTKGDKNVPIKYRAAANITPLRKLVCECGKPFESISANARRCKVCAKKAQRENQARWMRENRRAVRQRSKA